MVSDPPSCQRAVKLITVLPACCFIVEEWRSKWFLERKWQNSSTEELIKAMNDINDHVRLAAVSACSKAAEIRQRAKKEEPTSLGKNSSHEHN